MALPGDHDAAPERPSAVSRAHVTPTDLLLLLMSLIWGVNFSVIKFATTALDAVAFNGLRVALAALTLVAIGCAVRSGRPSARDGLALLALGVLGNGMYQSFFIQGIARTRAGNAALVLAATPALVALMGRMLGVEGISDRGLVGIGTSIAGVGLVVFGRDSAAA